MGEEVSTARSQSGFAKLRSGALWLLIAFILLIPKTMALRRKPRVWAALRLGLGLAGAGLVVAPLSGVSNWAIGAVGLVLFVIAALAAPSRVNTAMDNRATELGALVIVNGGRYEQLDGRVWPVRLFVGTERIWAMRPDLHPVVVVPVQEIVSARAAKSLNGWSLWLEWSGSVAEFVYEGFFAEHLARVAESTIRGVLRAPLAIIQHSQSAGA